MERLQIGKLFAHTGKFYRLSRNGFYRKRRTASCVTVKLCENNARNVKLLIKALRNVYRVLTCHSVNREKNFGRFNRGFDVFKLLHKLFVNMESACRIYNNNVICILRRVLQRLFRDKHRVGAFVDGKNGNTELFAHNFKLFFRRRTVNVRRNENGALALFFQKSADFRAGSGFSCALQAHHHNNGDFARKIKFRGFFSHKSAKLVVYNFYNLLSRREAFENVLSERLF